MENLTGLLELIQNYGLPMVISAIVVILFVVDRKETRKDFKRLLDTVIEDRKERDAEKTRLHDPTEDHKYDDTYNILFDILNILRTQADCSRCYVFVYHNGGKNLKGMPFQRLSCISESVAPGIEPMIQKYQGCQRSMFSLLRNKLKSQGYYFINDVNDLSTKDPILYNILVERSSNSACFFRITDHNTGSSLGFMGIEFIESKSQDDINSMIKLGTEATMRVSGLLEVISNDSNSISK